MICLFSFTGLEAEAHGGAATVSGVGLWEQAANPGPDPAVGGEPGKTALRTVQATLLHVQSAERGAAEPKGGWFIYFFIYWQIWTVKPLHKLLKAYILRWWLLLWLEGQQGKNGKEVREETEGKCGRVYWGR